MLDFADFVAINKFDRKGAEDALRDVRKQYQRNRDAFKLAARDHAGVRHHRRALQRRRRHRAVPGAAAAPGRARPASCSQAQLPDRRPRAVHRPGARSCRRARARYLAEIADTRARLPQARAASRRRIARERQQLAAAKLMLLADVRRARRGDARRADRTRAKAELDAARAEAAGHVAADAGEPTPATSTWSRSATRKCAPRSPPRRCRAARIRKVALPRFEDHGELLRGCCCENVPGSLPVHRRRVRLQARERGPDAHVRRRGRRLPHQPPLQATLRGHAGQAPVHRVRLGHALRLRPGRAPRHLRQGRQLGRVDRHARRHEGALRRLRPVQPDHLGVDDHQRPGADHPGDVPQHRDRPAARQVPRRQRPRADRGRGATRSAHGRWRPCAARCRPTSSRKTRARTPASSPPSSR